LMRVVSVYVGLILLPLMMGGESWRETACVGGMCEKGTELDLEDA
jgi:hypothetical protein